MSKKVRNILIFSITTTLIFVGTTIGIYRVYKVNDQKLHNNINDLKTEINSLKEHQKQQEKDYTDKEKALQNTINQLEEQNKQLDDTINDMLRKVSVNTEDVTEPSGVTLYHLKKMLKGTKLEGIEQALLNAEKEYNVNAIFLTSIVANESGWGTSKRAQTQNNLTGYAVYHDLSRGTTFSSKDQCIYGTAKLLANNYLNPNGKYYNGTSIYDVNTMYCQKDNKPNRTWTKQVTQICNELENKANS